MNEEMNYTTPNSNYKEFYASVNQEYNKYKGLCIVRILQGNTVWQIGSEVFNASAGDLIFLNNLEPRRRISASEDLKIAAYSFKIAFLTSVGSTDCLRCFYGRSDSFTHKLTAPDLLSVYDSIRNEMAGEQSQSLLLAYTIELLIKAGRIYDSQFPDALSNSLRCDLSATAAIADSTAYINSNLKSDLNLKILADNAGMSIGHYSRTFRKYVSVTPADYIAHCRIRHFLSLMQSGERNILEAAFECGFNSASNFYKTFKRICGCSPTEYKK